jgi:patatin-related protein
MPEAHPLFQPEQEVRFAVVMYGGVSLAIYINGVAQELFRLVKATAPAKPLAREEGAPTSGDERVYFPDDRTGASGDRPALEHSERVYRELGQRLGIAGLDAEAPNPSGDEPPPVRTRFVVDIVSGTSAGGINGVLLAKAIAEQQDFRVSERLWLEVADIAALLRGKDSWGDIPAEGRAGDPESLLNGHRLYREACKALQQMGRREIPDDPFLPAFAEQLELNVTATDLYGLPKPVRLGRDRLVKEKVHRKVFRFEYGISETLGEECSDFTDEHDELLAFSARATSSFPFAFEPVALGDVGFMTRGMPKVADRGPWFDGYDEPESVYFADGGYLDNKPFSYATQALRRRRADVPVSRKLIYIEPDPARDDAAPPADPERPDVYRNVMDAMGGLPRFEPIRQDIADVSARNGAIARLRDIESAAVDAAADTAAAPVPAPIRGAYLSLRARIVLDALGDIAARLRGWADDEDSAIATRDALRQWAAGRSTEAELARLDSAFEHRRGGFLHDRLNQLLRGDADDAEALQVFKRALNDAFDGLRRADRAPYARNLSKTLKGDEPTRFAAVKDAAARLPDETAAAGYVDAVAAFLTQPLKDAREGIAAALDELAPSPSGALLRAYDEQFELFDGIVLPLAYPGLGEANAVELWRVSPRDSTGALPAVAKANPPEKLAGLRLHHFGAFLDVNYRENDVLWGRLDGAEAILRAVLPDDKDAAEREQYRIAAQAAILREAMPQTMREALGDAAARRPAPANDKALLDAFLESYKVPEKLDDGRRQVLAGRALSITGQVLGKNASKHHIPKLPLTLLSRTGPTLARLAAVRRRLRNVFRRR